MEDQDRDFRLVTPPVRQSTVVKSAARAIEVLEYFSQIQRPASLKEIVERLDYPQSSATFLMKSLVSIGYVNYNRRTRTYVPTPKVVQLGQWLTTLVDPEILDMLDKIKDDTGETILLAIQNDLFIQYLEVLDSDHPMRFNIEKGSLMPMTQTSLGWVILSTKSPIELERICRQINSRTPARVELDDMRQNLQQIREAGYSYVRNLPMRAGGCVSMLLPTDIGGQTASIGTGGLVDRLDEALPDILASMRKHLGKYRRKRGL